MGDGKHATIPYPFANVIPRMAKGMTTAVLKSKDTQFAAVKLPKCPGSTINTNSANSVPKSEMTRRFVNLLDEFGGHTGDRRPGDTRSIDPRLP